MPAIDAKSTDNVNINGRDIKPIRKPNLFSNLPDTNVFNISSITAPTPKNIPKKDESTSLSGNSICVWAKKIKSTKKMANMGNMAI